MVDLESIDDNTEIKCRCATIRFYKLNTMKQTYIFDTLDNVIGNYMEDKANEKDVIEVAFEVNHYLLRHPHPHDIIHDIDYDRYCNTD